MRYVRTVIERPCLNSLNNFQPSAPLWSDCKMRDLEEQFQTWKFGSDTSIKVIDHFSSSQCVSEASAVFLAFLLSSFTSSKFHIIAWLEVRTALKWCCYVVLYGAARYASHKTLWCTCWLWRYWFSSVRFVSAGFYSSKFSLISLHYPLRHRCCMGPKQYIHHRLERIIQVPMPPMQMSPVKQDYCPRNFCLTISSERTKKHCDEFVIPFNSAKRDPFLRLDISFLKRQNLCTLLWIFMKIFECK